MAIRKTNTKEISRVGGLKVWLEAKPYWEQYLWRLHLEKDKLDGADLSACYQYLLEDSGVVKQKHGRPLIVFPVLDLDSADASGVKSTLNKIENMKNVNTIDSGCAINFGKNLTIIYGDNGDMLPDPFIMAFMTSIRNSGRFFQSVIVSCDTPIAIANSFCVLISRNCLGVAHHTMNWANSACRCRPTTTIEKSERIGVCNFSLTDES